MQTSPMPMDRLTLSAIAHRTHRFCSPLSQALVDDVLDAVSLPLHGRVLDLGCGNAELLRHVITRLGATGEGVDRSERMLEEAARRAEHTAERARLTLHQGDTSDFAERAVASATTWELVMMVGAGLGEGEGPEAALRTLCRLTRPGGYVLFGEPYWREPPTHAYLEALGTGADAFRDHAGNVAAGEAAGLVPFSARVAGEAEWDEYEWRYARELERWCLENPGHPEVPAVRERSRSWRNVSLTMGRRFLGFGLYLFHKAE